MRENFRYTVTFFGVRGRRPDGFKATGGRHVRPQVAYSAFCAGLAVSLGSQGLRHAHRKGKMRSGFS